MGHSTKGRTTYLTEKLKGVKKPKPKGPVWLGPESNEAQGGITQSMLASWLCCRDRFRIRTIEGLKPVDTFTKSLEYGNMIHVCAEAAANNKPWQEPLKVFCQGLAKKYPMEGPQVQHWYEVCKVQFPIYLKYWSKDNDEKHRVPLLQEEVFCVPYTLPYSGRVVYLRGKFDSVDIIGKGKEAGIYLMENKSKGDIDTEHLQRQLAFDLQTMIYLISLKEYLNLPDSVVINGKNYLSTPVRGVRYNVIRRPLSGGKHSIRQTQKETLAEYYERLGGLIQQDCNEATKAKVDSFFFVRWRVEITQTDIDKFKSTFLDPALECLCDWYKCVTNDKRTNQWDTLSYQNFRLPFGIFNTLAERGYTEVDEYLATGSTIGLERCEEMFPELRS
jgi:PD-(D/E)XK nuclease superfamily